MKPKRLILITSSFPYANGEPFLEAEIDFLCKEFEEVLILTQSNLDKNRRPIPENCSVKFIPLGLNKFDRIKALKGIFDPLFWKERKIIKKTYKLPLNAGVLKTQLISLFQGRRLKKFYSSFLEKPDQKEVCFYSYWSDDNSIALALLRKENTNIRCISRVHGWDVYFETTQFNYLPYRHLIADNLDAIYSISEAGRDYCSEKWKVSDPSKVKLSRLGVKEQQLLKPNSERFTLLSCSNVIPLKRVDLLVEALSLLPESVKLDWYHFGDGSDFEKVKLMASQKLQGKVIPHFLGRKSNSEVLEWYKEFKPNLFINVSTTEGVPVSIMEAMSFGTPVIATNVGGNGEIVNSSNGILLSANPSEEEVKNAILNMFERKENVISAYRENAFQTWRDEYNSEKNYSDFCASLLEL